MSWTSKGRIPDPSPRRLPADREGLDQEVLDLCALGDPLLELSS